MAERTAEVLTYLGKRAGITRAHVHVWQDAAGRELVYGRLAGQVIGGLYAVETKRDGDDISVYASTLRWTGDRIADTDQIRTWQAEEKADMASVERARLEKRAAAGDELEAALAPLRDLLRAQRTHAKRAALIAVVIDELYR